MSSLARRKALSRLIDGATGLCALLVIAALFVILSYIFVGGLRSISVSFLTNSPKPVGEPGSGIANAIVGSLILIALGTAWGMPVGILAGMYLAEFSHNRLGYILRFLIDTLTGVPSIVVGVFVWTVVVRPAHHFSALAGGIALGIMMLPIVARTTEEMVRLVPQSLREAGLALGAPRWRVSIGIVLKAAASGVATGGMLAVARIAGETAPLLFTALGLNYMSTNLNGPIASLPFQIFYYSTSPYDEWHSMAWAATLVLISMILFINISVKVLARNRYQQR